MDISGLDSLRMRWRIAFLISVMLVVSCHGSTTETSLATKRQEDATARSAPSQQISPATAPVAVPIWWEYRVDESIADNILEQRLSHLGRHRWEVVAMFERTDKVVPLRRAFDLVLRRPHAEPDAAMKAKLASEVEHLRRCSQRKTRIVSPEEWHQTEAAGMSSPTVRYTFTSRSDSSDTQGL